MPSGDMHQALLAGEIPDRTSDSAVARFLAPEGGWGGPRVKHINIVLSMRATNPGNAHMDRTIVAKRIGLLRDVRGYALCRYHFRQ